MTIAPPKAALSSLPRADGSATYSYAGYTITASVNGPIEAQRRDEHPYEALVDVIVRPASGVGGTRERHLESLLQYSLAQIILVKNFPRSLIQLVLQVVAAPENDYVNTKLAQASLNFSIIPPLLQTAILALLSAAIPLRTIATAGVVAVVANDGATRVIVDPTPRELETCRSAHVLAFTAHDELLLVESEGDFSTKEWDEVCEAAQKVCCQPPKQAGLDVMTDDDSTSPDMRHFLRSTMMGKVAADLHWK